jgi:hypothetical protein
LGVTPKKSDDLLIAYLLINQMKPVLRGNHPSLFDSTIGSSPNGLRVIARCVRVDAVTPQVGSKVGQSETWISLNEFLTELCAWLATRSCAKIEILDGPADLLGEHTALIGFCSEEPASKIHVVSTEKSCSAANIDQNDLRLKQFALSHQIFLHVDQND